MAQWKPKVKNGEYQTRNTLESQHVTKAIMLSRAPDAVAVAKVEAMFKDLPPLPPRRGTIRRPVDRKPVGPSEHQEQSAVIAWWSLACHGYGLPKFALFAIPNGGARDHITGARLKAEGVRKGAFDLCLAAAAGSYHGLYIEMKVGDNKPTPEQNEFKTYFDGAGYSASVHWSATSAIDAIKAYLAL